MTDVWSIAVGYDGSVDADAAVRWAIALATPLLADVTVVHAAGLLEHQRIDSPRDEVPPAIVELARECNFDIGHLRWFVDDGDACSVLLRLGSPPINADILVVGSRGRGKREGLLLGSTSLQVAQSSLTPVVIVPSGDAHH